MICEGDRQADNHTHTHILTHTQRHHPLAYPCRDIFCEQILCCGIRDAPVQTHIDMHWMYFRKAKSSSAFGENVLHWLPSFITAVASALVRNPELKPQQEPQLIKDTIALSWNFYLWEHCCHTCHWLAARHNYAVHHSIQIVYSFFISPLPGANI